MYFIIAGWGYQPEKIKATYSIFFYTIISSSTLILILLIYLNLGWVVFDQLVAGSYEQAGFGCTLVRVFLCLTFLTKIPVILFHAWLPQAHVEAPVYGSIILAGIILKVGAFGLYRFLTTLDKGIYLEALCYLRIVRALLVRASAFYTTDIKKNIAFTSIVHIAFVVLTLALINKFGLSTAFMIMANHAFRSRAIFFGVTRMYSIRHSRNILFIKGALKNYPKFISCWFLCLTASLGIPPIVNFLGEFNSLILICSFYFEIRVFVVLSWCVVGCYHLLIYFAPSHGSSNRSLADSVFRVYSIDYLILIFLIRASILNLFIIFIVK